MSGQIIELPVSPATPESPVTPEITKLKDGISMRNSAGRTSTSNGKEKTVPIYLRASASSCHDLCKYGMEHTSETNGRQLILKKLAKPASGVQSPVKTVTVEERKKQLPVVKPKPSPELKTPTQAHDKSKIIKRETKILTRDVPSPDKSKIIKCETMILTREVPSPDKPKIIKLETKTREVPSPTKKISVTAKLASSLTKVSSPTKKIFVSAKPAISLTKVSSPSKKIVVKPAISLKPKLVTTKLSSSPSNSSRGLSSKRNSNSKIVDGTAKSRIVEKKPLVTQTASLSPKPLVNRVATLDTRKSNVVTQTDTSKDQNKVRKVESKQPNAEKMREKTLYVIELKPEKTFLAPCVNGSRSSQSSQATLSTPPIKKRSSSSSLSSISSSAQSSQSLYTDEEDQGYESSPSKVSGSVSERKETEDRKTLKPKHRRTMAPTVHSEDKNLTGKQNYRKGKVVNLEAENNGARKLRFRQRKGLGDNQNGKGEISEKSFRKRREVDNGNGTKPESTKPESEKVVLRHQDVQEKDEQVVINNVIEETASKLVETRKSKVKALVGAFETVISLHDTKPSATTSAC